MCQLEDLKELLGDDYKFTALLSAEKVQEIIEKNDFEYSDDVPFVLEAGNLDIEITIFADNEHMWLGYDCCRKSDGEWESFDTISDEVNLDVPSIENEMFRVLDKFAEENNLSYFTQEQENDFDEDDDLEL